MSSHDKIEKMNARGLPDLSEAEKAKASGKSSTVVLVSTLVVPLIGLAMALAVLKFGAATAKYEAKIETVVNADLHWLFLSAAVMARLVTYLNMLPMVWKSKVFRRKSGNLRANLYVFKSATKPDDPAIVLEDKGDVGAYNRANRSLHHFSEYVAATIVTLLLSGYVFPLPSFVATVTFALGRILHMTGYTKGYGKHGIGFALATLSTTFLEGACLVVGLKGALGAASPF
eukprot:g4675.t1